MPRKKTAPSAAVGGQQGEPVLMVKTDGGEDHTGSDIPEIARKLDRIEARLDAMWKPKSLHDFLTVEEVAAELRVSETTAKRLCASGSIRSKEIVTGEGTGARCQRRVRRDWLHEYVEKPSMAPKQRQSGSRTTRRKKSTTRDWG